MFDGASLRFANQASGPVSTFTLGARETGTFVRIEYPALMSNPRVTALLVNGERPLWKFGNVDN